MQQNEYVPRNWSIDPGSSISQREESGGTVDLVCTGNGLDMKFTFEAFRKNVFRTTFSSQDHPLPPHPSIRRFEGYVDGGVNSKSEKTSKKISNNGSTALIEWKDTPVVTLYIGDQEEPIHQDLRYRSYGMDSTGIVHYTTYKKNTLHVGLGEKAAPMDLSNRQFILSATDCFGYDVYRTDPMYKHIPLLINLTPKGCVGMFSTSHSRGIWSVGSEMDGLWGPYKVYRQAYGGLEEYLIIGKSVQKVLNIYAGLVGFPKLVPRWALGYIAGGMKYSMLDKPRARDALLEFAANLKWYDIPCSAFQMSSGYTVSDQEPKTRNVFTWNRHRFPDPQAFTKAYHEAGIRLIANVKPYVLTNHPDYEKLAKAGALFTDPVTKQTGVARLWSAGGGESGEGGHIDFTSNSGFDWWFKGVQALRAVGIDAIWNDNNEYVIPHDNWQLALENTSSEEKSSTSQTHLGLWGRAMQCELMAKASHDALVALEPHLRPFVLTRSATAGTMKYAASTWSGDNVTSWQCMKGANAVSLNAGMSLLQSYGHDIGGFEGPQPSPELLLRWVQLGVYSPRFAINCFKTSQSDNLVGDVIEPWMYPEITPLIRNAIKRRYELIPYLHSCALESHLFAVPPQRWVGFSYESDPEVWSPLLIKGETQYWLGDNLLIGGAYKPGDETVPMYLPRGDESASMNSKLPCSNESFRIADIGGYINVNAPYQHFPAGKWVTIESHWRKSIPVLARIGAAIPVGKPAPTFTVLEDREEFPSLVPDDYRGLEIYPPKGVSSATWYNKWYEEDGLSARPSIYEHEFKYHTFEKSISVFWQTHKYLLGDFRGKLQWEELNVILPVGEEREIVRDGNIGRVTDMGRDSQTRRVFRLSREISVSPPSERVEIDEQP